MSEFTKKVSENIKKLDELKEVIPNIDFEIQNEVIQIDLIKKKITNYNNELKQIITVEHEEFPENENVIRLYLPIMGEAGYVPTEEEIIKLFKGEKIYPPKNAFLSKNSKPYSLDSFEFKPLSENVYKNKVKYYGELVAHFPTKKKG